MQKYRCGREQRGGNSEQKFAAGSGCLSTDVLAALQRLSVQTPAQLLTQHTASAKPFNLRAPLQHPGDEPEPASPSLGPTNNSKEHWQTSPNSGRVVNGGCLEQN